MWKRGRTRLCDQNAGHMNVLLAIAAAFSLATAAVAAAAPGAADPRQLARAAKSVADAQAALGVTAPEATRRIRIESPDIVDASRPNGARVPVRVTSAIPGTEWIAVFVEPGARPLVAMADIAPGAKPVIEAVVPVQRTSAVRVVVRASGKYYQLSREIKAADKGCGA